MVVKTNTPTSKPLINTAAIEQQLFQRQQIAEDLQVCIGSVCIIN